MRLNLRLKIIHEPTQLSISLQIGVTAIPIPEERLDPTFANKDIGQSLSIIRLVEFF